MACMTTLVFAAMYTGYSLGQTYELQNPLIVKVQLPWRHTTRSNKIKSPISFNQISEAHDMPEIKPQDVDIFNQDQVKAYIAQEGAKEFGENQVESLLALIHGESSFNPIAQNSTSTAFGTFQFLDDTWENYNCKKTVDIKKQTECGFRYIKSKYGTPSKALSFWESNSPHWY